MHTATSTFKISGGYGGFTIPKSLLIDLGWKSGDLIEFHGLGGQTIMIQRIYTKEKLQELKEKGKVEYNKEWSKKIAKFGIAQKTLGVRTFPKPLISEFNIKDGQTIYFLPATNTWLGESEKSSSIKEMVFATFNEENLKRLEKFPEKDKEKEQKEFKNMLKDKNHYNLHLFHGRVDISEENSPRTKKRFKGINKIINKDRILAIEVEIERVKGELEEVKSSSWRAKKEIARTHRDYIKGLTLKIKELKTNPEKIF